MRKSGVLGVVLAAVLAARASAAELDAAEKAWVAQCVANLSAKSERIRVSAENAIGAMGVDALPSVLASIAASKTEPDWHALALAVAAMGPGASKALADLRPSWPEFAATRLPAVVDEVRSLEEKAAKRTAPSAERPTTPEDVERAVAEILSKYEGATTFTSNDPSISKIVRIGRPAIGVLVRELCEAETHERWAMRMAAQEALVEIVDESDAPMLAAAAREGHVDVEAAFEKLESPAAVEALAGLIRDGVFDTSLDSVLANKIARPEIVSACCDWLAKPVYEGDMDFAIAKMAESVSGGHMRMPPEVAARLGLTPEQRRGMTAAAAPLARLLARDLRIDARRRVASALVRLGDKAGIPVLIDVVVSKRSDDFTGYERHAAGEDLNEVSGTKLYVGRTVEVDDGTGHRWEGNFAEAAEGFRAWWAKSKDELRHDPATGKWGK